MTDQTAVLLEVSEEKCSKVAEIFMDRLIDPYTDEKACETILDIYDICGISPRFILDIRTHQWMYSQTALMVSASRNKLNCCKRLIEMGADIHETDLQGYTALHHAALNGSQECAKFLVDLGADPNGKSKYGRNCYDLGIYNYLKSAGRLTYKSVKDESSLFTYSSTPKQKTEIFELAGAFTCDYTVEMWDKAIEVCRKFDLQPSTQLLADLQFFGENGKISLDFYNEHFNRLAINTVARLSEENSKFWYLLKLVAMYNRVISSSTVLQIFNLISEELNRVADFESVEEVDYNTLYELVDYFARQLKKLDNFDHLQRISHLTISCFNKRIQITNSNTVSKMCMDLYIELVLVLTSTQYFRYNAPKLNENLRLLRTLIKLDLRDRDRNSLMHHLILQDDHYNGYAKLSIIETLLKNDLDVNVASRNRYNQEPVQVIKWDYWNQNGVRILNIVTKMAENGAHFDAEMANGGPTLREVFQKKTPYLAFRYDNLQCACARVLARSNVPYRNRAPKCISEFIQVHMPQL